MGIKQGDSGQRNLVHFTWRVMIGVKQGDSGQRNLIQFT